jgi:catechol 2,3-dioxygenase-like lactoylglutathione lyase family enzyme
MATTGALSHIDISVGYPEKSIPFYAALLEGLGYERWEVSSPAWQGDSPRRATWSMRHPDGTSFGIEVRPAREASRDRHYDRYEPGPHHIAFHAESEAVVDRVHEGMVAAGAEVLDPPTQYGGQKGYGEAYYAAFYADPDGVKLEVAFIPREPV